MDRGPRRLFGEPMRRSRHALFYKRLPFDSLGTGGLAAEPLPTGRAAAGISCRHAQCHLACYADRLPEDSRSRARPLQRNH
jgi:hypothetical protein